MVKRSNAALDQVTDPARSEGGHTAGPAAGTGNLAGIFNQDILFPAIPGEMLTLQGAVDTFKEPAHQCFRAVAMTALL